MAWIDGSHRGRRLKDDIRSGRTVVGTFLNMGSPLAAEACAIAGFDWLLVDLEHGGRGEDGLLAQILAGAAHDVPVIVRAETTDRIRSGRVLDLGANGVMFPRVSSREEAALAASNLRYPPEGWRGVATYNRSCGFGTHPETLANCRRKRYLLGPGRDTWCSRRPQRNCGCAGRRRPVRRAEGPHSGARVPG